MKTLRYLEPWQAFSLSELSLMPVIIRLRKEPEKVAARNGYANQLGVRKGMLFDLVNYFCWRPLVIEVEDINDLPFGVVN